MSTVAFVQDISSEILNAETIEKNQPDTFSAEMSAVLNFHHSEVQVALALVNEIIYILRPVEEQGTTGETTFKADLMLNYTFSEFAEYK